MKAYHESGFPHNQQELEEHGADTKDSEFG